MKNRDKEHLGFSYVKGQIYNGLNKMTSNILIENDHVGSSTLSDIIRKLVSIVEKIVTNCTVANAIFVSRRHTGPCGYIRFAEHSVIKTIHIKQLRHTIVVKNDFNLNITISIDTVDP